MSIINTIQCFCTEQSIHFPSLIPVLASSDKSWKFLWYNANPHIKSKTFGKIIMPPGLPTLPPSCKRICTSISRTSKLYHDLGPARHPCSSFLSTVEMAILKCWLSGKMTASYLLHYFSWAPTCRTSSEMASTHHLTSYLPSSHNCCSTRESYWSEAIS